MGQSKFEPRTEAKHTEKGHLSYRSKKYKKAKTCRYCAKIWDFPEKEFEA